MKILLLGCQGQVGQELRTTLTPWHRHAWSRPRVRFSCIRHHPPKLLAQSAEVIVNAAAYTAVDKAEQRG
jgi:dTDP-4-dehydrorhamnose reductase